MSVQTCRTLVHLRNTNQRDMRPIYTVLSPHTHLCSLTVFEYGGGTKVGISKFVGVFKLVGVYKSCIENDALHPTRPDPTPKLYVGKSGNTVENASLFMASYTDLVTPITVLQRSILVFFCIWPEMDNKPRRAPSSRLRHCCPLPA